MAEEESNEQHSSVGFDEVHLLPVPTSWLETPHIDPSSTVIQMTHAQSYKFSQFLSMLSSVDFELHPAPSQDAVPPPITTSVMLSKKENSSRFEKGESSGTMKNSADQSTKSDLIHHASDLGESERKRKQDRDDPQPLRRRRRSTEHHNLTERRRRNLVRQRISALQELIPNSHKTDQASIVFDAIEYIKLLQRQLQMISMQAPYIPSLMPMQPLMGMGLYRPAIPSHFPVFPPSGFQPVSQLQFPFCSTTSAPPSTVTITATSLPSADEISNVDEEAQKSNFYDSTESYNLFQNFLP